MTRRGWSDLGFREVAEDTSTTLFDLSGFALDVEEIVGRHVDVTPRGLKARIRDRVLAEAVAL